MRPMEDSSLGKLKHHSRQMSEGQVRGSLASVVDPR